MHEQTILQIDSAALGLIQALSDHWEELHRYLDGKKLEALRGDIVNLRRLLLALEMGILYQGWEPPAEVLDTVACICCDEAIPLNEVASNLSEMIDQQRKGTE